MDKVPSGVPPGADGAFERFLTAALATIITIMFSWRLMTEEEEAAGGRQQYSTSGLVQTAIPYPTHRPATTVGANNRSSNINKSTNIVPTINVSKPAASSPTIRDLDIDDTDTSPRSRSDIINREVRETVLTEHFEPSYARKTEHVPDSYYDDSVSFPDDDINSDSEDTLTTWDEYKWEEELGEEQGDVIKTKRSVRDFVTPSKQAIDSDTLQGQASGERPTDINMYQGSSSGSRTQDDVEHKSVTSSTGSPSLTFAQRFANFEYKDNGGDSGYIDLYPDVDSDDNTDSSDDERVYEIDLDDSDSDSGDDRGMPFFGVTALDTIMEEIESEVVEEEEEKVKAGIDNVVECLDNKETVITHESPTIFDSSQTVLINGRVSVIDSVDVDEGKLTENNNNNCEVNIVPDRVGNVYESLQPSGVYSGVDINQTESLSKLGKFSEAERNQQGALPSNTPFTADDTGDDFNLPQETTHHRVAGSGKECDLNVDNISPVRPHNTECKHENDAVEFIANRDSCSENELKSARVETNDKTLQYSNEELSDRESVLRSPSPVKTSALDNLESLADDQISDTESCAESVITVVSMKSTDSDNYTPDLCESRDPSTNLPVTQPVSQTDTAPGHPDQLLLINDKHNNYEPSSLVSGFLNDSLNSLLSNKTAESEYSHSDGDIESGLPVHKSDESLTGSDLNLEPTVVAENAETQYQTIQNGSLKDSSSESLPLADNDSNEYSITVNGHGHTFSSSNFMPLDNYRHDDEMTDMHVVGDYIDSDSDSSDPPLREYDPDDDDLAAFQFSHDGDDDSFYLLVGDEGSLRNFETFTNLNSVGLNEYSDAVISHAPEEDARGFTFSRTEEIDTQVRKRAYFTDRSASDSDAQSDDHVLSPIHSEDEEMVPIESRDIVESSPVNKKSPYDDAELSTVTQPSEYSEIDIDQRGHIDFHKYIIPSQKDSNVNTSPGSLVQDRENVNKEGERIDIDTNISSACEQIDAKAVKCDTVCENPINNEISGQLKTEYSVDVDSVEKSQEKETDKDSCDSIVRTSAYNDETNVENRQPTQRSKKETNIDDLFIPDVNVSQNETYETGSEDTSPIKIEHLEETNVPRVRSSPAKSKIETNIDDLFTDEVSNTLEKPSSPVAQQKGENTGDLTQEINNSERFKKSPIRRDSAVETCIDDIFTSSPAVGDENKLSYETFVDDLFDKVVPSDASQPECVPSTLTSESDGVNKIKTDGFDQNENGRQTEIVCDTVPRQSKTSESEPRSSTLKRNNTDKPQSSVQANVEKEQTQEYIDPHCVPYSKDRPVSDQNDSQNNSRVQQLSPINIVSESNNTNKPDGHILIGDSVNECKQLQKPDYNGNVSVPKTGILTAVENNELSSGPSPADNYRIQTSGQGTVSEDSPQKVDLCSGVDRLDYTTHDERDIELRISEADENETSQRSKSDSLLDNSETSSIGSCSITSDDELLNSIGESYNILQNSYNESRRRGLSDSSLGRVVRTPNTKPSDLKTHNKQKELKGVKKRVHKHQLRKYTSILQSPVTPEHGHVTVTAPELKTPVSRLKVEQSRQKFLSAENLADGSFEDKFLQHRTSLVSSTPRKYIKLRDRHRDADSQSTESLPNMFSYLHSSYGSNTSMDRMHSLPSPRNIDELYASRPSSTNTSFEKPDHHKLHENCIFSPEKRAEITHTTQSLENMFEQLLRYGSINSVAETDIDAVDANDQLNNSFHDSFTSDYVSFQYPLERAASMSALTATSEEHRLPRKPGKGRFASRKVPKSKSLQTLETNLDDVFADETELTGGPLKKVPSVHELRVSKSLTKLAVPDWFKKSTFSRSDSTQSLFTYARQGSTSTLGSCAYPPSVASRTSSPSLTPNRGAIVIQKRVTPSPAATSPSARLVRAPLLPTTPEKAPIAPTNLPSDKYRKDPKKELKPIPIIPFAKIREMFERKAQEDAAARKSSISSPTKETPPSSLKVSPAVSPTKEPIPILKSPSRETAIDAPVQNQGPVSPTGVKPCIVPESARRSGSDLQKSGSGRRMQVHFSDEKDVSKPVDKNSNSEPLRQNGTKSVQPDKRAPSSGKSTNSKTQSLRASLPMPQFRFRRPGIFATKAATQQAAQNTKTQSKKGKRTTFIDNKASACETLCNGYNPYSDSRYSDNDNCIEYHNDDDWVHALEYKAKTDGETLFEFLQKRQYSSLLENGFAEQLDELQHKESSFNFPVLALGKHSSHSMEETDGSPELQVILTHAQADQFHTDFVNHKLREDASLDDILDGLLVMNGHSTGRMRMNSSGQIVPRTPSCPETPPGMTFNLDTTPGGADEVFKDKNDNVYVPDEFECEYTIVRCENDQCSRETNLKEARQCYKTCQSCFTYYCSKACRKQDWEKHKKACIYGRLGSACKHVIKFVNKHPTIQYQCSRIARRGYLAQGRGCIVFAFPDIGSAEDFLCYGMESLWVPPVYVSIKDLPNALMLGSKLEFLTQTCKQYNPELKYVIHVAIVIPPKLASRPVPRRKETIVQKCAKLRLSPAHMHPKQAESDGIPSTLILTAVPGNQHADELDCRKTRELCFINIQRKLRQRGVSLRHQFPNVYNKLIDFVSDAKHFSPMIIYPIDCQTGKKFMCVIMPDSEPEIEWIRDPDLFHELDVFDEVEDSTPNLSLCLLETESML